MGDAQAEIADERVDILAAHRQRVLERNRVVDVHRRRDGPHGVALQHALEQVLDGAACALLRLELLIRLAPHAHHLVLRDGVAGQVPVGRSIRLGKQGGDGRRVFLGHVCGALERAGDDDADGGIGEQLPEGFLCDKLGHVIPRNRKREPNALPKEYRTSGRSSANHE